MLSQHFLAVNLGISRVPTRTGKTGKPGKMGRHFPVREKSGNFEQTGKVREKSGKTIQNTGKLREFQKKLFVIPPAMHAGIAPLPCEQVFERMQCTGQIQCEVLTTLPILSF